MEIVNTRTGTTESVTFSQAECQGLLGSTEESNQDEVDVVNMMLYVKDRYCISGDGYHEMAQACKSMQRHYRIKTRIRELNYLWNVQPTPNGIVGVQQSLEERLRAHIVVLLKSAEELAPFKSSHIIWVKLTGDGTMVVGDFIQLHGLILAFTQQGLEKYNDITTKYYFRSTHHKGEQALRQLMEKQNRIDHLRDSQAKQPKHHDIRCGNCTQEGHNKLTCSQPCKVCGAEEFKKHLVLQHGRHVPICEQENS